MDGRYLKKQNFGEIFENVTRLTGKVGLNSLAAGFVVLVLPFLYGNHAIALFCNALSIYFMGLVPYGANYTSIPPEVLMPLLEPLSNAILPMMGYMLLQWVAITFLHAFVSVNVQAVLQEERPDIFSVALKALRRAFPVALLTSVLISFSIAAIWIAFSVLEMVIGGLGAGALIVFLTLAHFAVTISFSVITTQAIPQIILEEKSSIQSIGGSFSLIKGSFFRYLGMNIILSLTITIMLGMVLSVFISTTLISLLTDFAAYLQPVPENYEALVLEGFSRLMQGVSESVWLLNSVGTIFTILSEIIMSVFFMVSCLDLKARKNPPVPEEAASGVQE